MAENSSKYKSILALNEANAAVLVEIITGPNISEALRIQAMEKLVASKEDQSFFKTIYEEKLSYGECPKCNHKNHFLIPEDALNEMGWVSNKQDERVPEHTTAKECPTYQEACLKKKITT